MTTVAGIELPTPEVLAVDFSTILNDWLTPEEMAEVRRRNDLETNANICHSHDFRDANMAMDEAMRKYTGRDTSDLICEDTKICTPQEIEVVCSLWNQAWDIAKKGGFSVPKLEAQEAPEAPKM